MSDELAVYLGSPARLRALGEKLLQASRGGGPLRGAEIIAEVSDQLPAPLRVPFLWLLVNEGVAETLEVAPAVEEYLLRVDSSRLRHYLHSQVRIAEVLERAEARAAHRRGPSRIVEVVATLPPELFIRDEVPSLGSIEPAIKKVIASARKRAWIVNPFFDPFGLGSLVPSISGALDRGVSVRIITREVSHQRESLASTFTAVQHESRGARAIANLEVRDLLRRDESTGRLQYALHSKVVLADSESCYIGSANVTEHGMRHNFELGIVLRGEAVAEVRDLLERLWEVSTPVRLPLA